MQFRPQGFSLIELMIVVSLISILAVMAIPSYQDYTKRARFAEVVAITEVFKIAVALAIQQGVPFAELVSGSHGIPPEPKSTKNLASLKVENGMITAVATELINSATYILKPNTDGSSWAISGSCIKSGFCNT